MKDDHCIITKYDLSEREKQIKKNFFSKDNHTKSVPATKKEINQTQKSYIDQENISEELVNKMVNENLKSVNLQTQAFRGGMQNQNQGSIPLNLIYSQNRVLERNVDLLGETQRSLHDLLIYNIKTNQNNEAAKLKDEVFRENKKLFQDFLAPVLQNINQLKIGMENMAKSDKKQDGNDNLSNKVNDMVSRHSDFKDFHSNMEKTKKSIDLIEKNKTIQAIDKNNPFMKTIEEVKSSVSGLNLDMKNLEENIKDSLKKIIENQEKKNLMGGIQMTSGSNRGKGAGYQGAKNDDGFDYLDAKVEFMDIMQRSNEIFNEFNSNKHSFPKRKITDKVNFSYKLDFEEEDVQTTDTDKNSGTKKVSTMVNKGDKGHVKNSSTKNIPNKAFDADGSDNFNKQNTKPNVFLNNYDEKKATNKANNIKSAGHKPQNSSGQYKNMMNNNNNQQNKNNQNNNNKINQNNNQMKAKSDNNIETHPTMKVKANEINTNKDSNNFKVDESLNIFSTKNTEPRNIKSPHEGINSRGQEAPLKTRSQDKLLTIPENIVKKIEGPTGKVLHKVTEEQKDVSFEVSRKGIKEVEMPKPKKDKFTTIEDVITKLCVERLINQTNKKYKTNQDYIPSQNDKITIGGEVNLPFGCQPNQISYISEHLMRDKIKSLLKNKKPKEVEKLPVSQGTTNNVQFDEDSFYNRFKNEMDKKDTENQKLLKALMDRIELLSKEQPKPNENTGINIDELVDKVSTQLKGNLHINVNLKQELPPERESKPLTFKSSPIKIKKPKLEEIEKLKPKEEEYVNPFNYKYTAPVMNYEEVQVPHMLNLSEYDVSSVSGFSDSKITRQTPRKEDKENDESKSEGQILHSISTPVSKSNYFSPDEIETIELRGTGNIKSQIDKQMTGMKNKQYNDPNDYLRQFEESLDDSERVSLQSEQFNNKKTGPIDINNNKMLKNLNLYESGEHMKFQKDFGQGQGQNLQKSQRMDYGMINNSQNRPDTNSQRSEYLNFGPSGRSGNTGNNNFGMTDPTQRSNASNAFKFIKNPNQAIQQQVPVNQAPVHQSFGINNVNLESERSNTISSPGSFKLHKVNQEEIEKLKKMKNTLQDRMKTIVSNNSVSENTDGNESNI